MHTIVRAFILLSAFAFMNQVFASSVFTISNNNSGNAGFNDTTRFTPVGGNNATTLGQARLNALQYAANQLSKRLNSSVNIDLAASFAALGGSATGAVLAQTGNGGYHHNFTGAPLTNVLYHAALANKLAGMEINQQAFDMIITVNSDIDGAVFGNTKWYYGFDGNPSNRDIDFVTVATHEILHGLGFSTDANPNTGALFRGFNDAYVLNLEHHGATPAKYAAMTADSQRAAGNKSSTYDRSNPNLPRIIAANLHWIGAALLAKSNQNSGFENGHAGMYSPNPVQGGSSVSHFSTLFNAPNEMMEPSYKVANHDIGFAAQVLEDIGWGKLNSDSRSVDLSVEVTNANLNPVRGSNETYFISVTNKSGTNPATGIVVSQFLPANSTFVSVNPASAATCDTSNVAQNRIVTCSLTSLPVSGVAVFSVVVRINNAAGNIFSANVEALNPDPIVLNNSAVNTVLVNNEKPPVFSPIVDQTIEEGKTLTLTIAATDPNNGDIPTLSVLNLPNGATFVANGNGQATFTWTPVTADVGINIINFEATDGKSPAVAMSVKITVTAKPVPVPTPTPTPNPGTPPPPADTPVAGCTLNKSAKFDPSFPMLLLIFSVIYFVRKKKLLM